MIKAIYARKKNFFNLFQLQWSGKGLEIQKLIKRISLHGNWNSKHFMQGSDFWITECMRVCSVTKSYLTLYNPTDCSPPGSSVHEISQPRILEWAARIFLTQGSNPHLLHWQADSLPLTHLGGLTDRVGNSKNPLLP